MMSGMDAASFRVSWSRFPAHVLSALDELRQDEEFIDVDIYCAGERIKAHRIVLSASSTYFKDIFKANPSQHPVVILCDVDFESLRSLVDFMYHGEIEVPTARLDELLRLGEMLQVHGISSPKSPAPSGTAPSSAGSASDGGMSDHADATVSRKRRRRCHRSRSPGSLPAPEPPLPAREPALPVPHTVATVEVPHVRTGLTTGSANTTALDEIRNAMTSGAGGGGVMEGLLPLLSACAVELPTPPVRASALPQSCLSPPPEAPQSPLPEAEDLTAPHRSPSPGPAEIARDTPPPEQPTPATVKTEPLSSADSESKPLLDDIMEHAGMDSSQHLGVYTSALGGLGRPMTGAERARRYRERKKLKKLYESLLGSSPGREQLAVQL